MGALILSNAGAAVGGAVFGPAGALFGRVAGALGGNLLDRALLGGGTRNVSRAVEGPRTTDLDVMTSTEGAPIARIYGRVKTAGDVIWATKLEEVINVRVETSESGGGGKGGGGGRGTVTTTTTTTYSYFGNFAVGLCEGEIGQVARVWADGKPLDLAGLNTRFYNGDETQTADPLIVAKQGAGQAPAYRGLAYIVFERMPLAAYGNRIPQLQFELVRPVDRLERMTRAVTLVPGTTEFGYEPAEVVRLLGPGRVETENRHVGHAASDVVASLDALQAACPNLEHVALVVAWFGNDLRAGECTLYPAVDNAIKQTHGATWYVAGLTRATAPVVSTLTDGRAAYGGTPSDQSVLNLIAELKARELKVTLYPFVVMDVPAGNARPDPHSGAASQPVYPWRGRITCYPAPGRPGTPDGTAAAATQINAFFGTTADWRYRRMILHYADLAVAAGGVDAFLIGSEMRGLTRVRSGAGLYPAVSQFVTLAGEVRAIVGTLTKITYAADWTEYGAHVVDAGANEIRFPLDPLWASSAIDAIGIDYYAPLSDWRDGASHLDRVLTETIYDRDYLTANLRGGEAYDWFYADAAARNTQTRTPITDGLGKPFVHRQKDLWGFWANAHRERVSGVELSGTTAWVPQSKPIWFTEVGCPAVDKGSNAPNAFPDAKSSEGIYPPFSNRSRDDLIQRRYLEGVLGAFDPAHGATLVQNPVSGVTGARMLDPARLYLWTWDARPYPAFPAATEVWSDGVNWETGHWLNGRLGNCPLDGLVSTILSDAGIGDCDSTALGDGPEGYLIERPMAPRAAIEPLSSLYAFEAVERASTLAFRPRGGEAVAELTLDDLVLDRDEPKFRMVRAQESELPREISVGFTDSGADLRRGVALSRRLTAGGNRVAHTDLAVVGDDTAIQRRADIWLQDLWAGRERIEFSLSPRHAALMPGDVVGLTIDGRRRLLEITELVDTNSRAVRARSIDPEVFSRVVIAPRRRAPSTPPTVGPVLVHLLDLPAQSLTDDVLTRTAVFADPWPGPVAIWRSFDGQSFGRVGLANAPAIVGTTLDPLPAGPIGRFDRAARVRVELAGGQLVSAQELAVRDGANNAAIRGAGGAWEVIQYANAELVGERTYELSVLLRGQAGTEYAMAASTPAGADFVRLDAQLVPIARGVEQIGRPMQLRIVVASRDHGDPAAVALEHTPSALALRPLSPSCVRARRTADGIVIDFARRTRADGDSWQPGDIPLGEEREAYAVEVMDGVAVKRTLTAATTRLLYPVADELADFGAPLTAIALRIAQVSATAGRGHPTSATLPL